MDVKDDFLDTSYRQIQAILRFQQVTGVVNSPRVRDILNRHNWQLEEAVYDQLNLNVGCPSIYLKKSEVPDLRVELNFRKLQVFDSRNPGTNGYLSFVVNYVMRKFYDKVVSSMSFSWRSLWSKREPVSDVESFINYFNSEYGDSHPTFYKGSYNQALNEAKRELLFLVVYLHTKYQSDCSNFCSLLTNDKIISFMNEGNILFWACDLDTNEGNRVATIHQAHNVHPYVSVILLVDGIMTQVAQMKGIVSIQEFLDRLQTLIMFNEPNISEARVERIKKHSTLIEWKDLKCDREKEILDKEEQEKDDVLQSKLLEIRRMFKEQELKKMEKLEEYKQIHKLKRKQITLARLIMMQEIDASIKYRQNLRFVESIAREERLNDGDIDVLDDIINIPFMD